MLASIMVPATEATAMSNVGVTFTPTPAVEGIVPTQVQFQATPATDLTSGDTIEVGATYAIWAAVGAVTCTVTVDGFANTALFASTDAVDTSRFLATVASPFQTAAAGDELVFTCTDNLSPYAEVGTNVRFYFQSTTDSSFALTTGWTTILGRLDSPAVAITPASAVEYTVPDQIVLSATTTNGLVAADAITISADNAPVWTVIGSIDLASR